jgi:polyisoprenoid-binding protein YceI
MDETMWGKLKVTDFKNILYFPSELSLKEAPKSKDAPYIFDAKGDLMVAGVTNTVTMPVNVLPMADGKIKISGTVQIKMSSFKIVPSVQVPVLGDIKIGDEVKLIFDWMVGPAKATSAAK